MSENISILDAVPVHGDGIATQWKDGLAILARPRPKGWLDSAIPWLKQRTDYIYLETYGSAVWLRVDGIHTVQEIVESVLLLFPEEPDLVARILKYVTQMHRDGLLKLLSASPRIQ